MERESVHQIAQREAEIRRADPNIVGVWNFPDLEKNGSEYLVYQWGDQSAVLISYSEGKVPEILHGNIIFKRRESGHPIRVSVFIDKFGEKEVVIPEPREF
jgi:hypothetical protein